MRDKGQKLPIEKESRSEKKAGAGMHEALDGDEDFGPDDGRHANLRATFPQLSISAKDRGKTGPMLP